MFHSRYIILDTLCCDSFVVTFGKRRAIGDYTCTLLSEEKKRFCNSIFIFYIPAIQQVSILTSKITYAVPFCVALEE